MKTGDSVQPDCKLLHYNYNHRSSLTTLKDIPDEVDGAPCAIQVIAPRFQDERCLWAADIIDRTIRG